MKNKWKTELKKGDSYQIDEFLHNSGLRIELPGGLKIYPMSNGKKLAVMIVIESNGKIVPVFELTSFTQGDSVSTVAERICSGFRKFTSGFVKKCDEVSKWPMCNGISLRR